MQTTKIGIRLSESHIESESFSRISATEGLGKAIKQSEYLGTS